MKTTITLKLDTSILREIRILAAEQGKSIGGFLSEKLTEIVRDKTSFARARRRALARLNKGYDLGWTKPASRDQYHER